MPPKKSIPRLGVSGGTQVFAKQLREGLKKNVPLFGVPGGTQVFAKQLRRHIFRIPTKNLTISDQYFQKISLSEKRYL